VAVGGTPRRRSLLPLLRLGPAGEKRGERLGSFLRARAREGVAKWLRTGSRLGARRGWQWRPAAEQGELAVVHARVEGNRGFIGARGGSTVALLELRREVAAGSRAYGDAGSAGRGGPA
jgi:hypothetical protein